MKAPINVLIVDDDLSILTGLCNYLEDEGFYVQCARSGEEAMEILEKERFHVAVVDMRLPGMDGNTLIKTVHQLYSEMKFLIYTGSTEYDLSVSLKELGMRSEDVICKPLPDQIIIADAIRRITEG